MDVDPTAAALTQLGISLPIASAMTGYTQCSGNASMRNLNERAAIYADVTNDRAEMVWTAVDVANQAWHFSFTYLIV